MSDLPRMDIGARFAWVRAVISANPRPSLAAVAVAVCLAEHFNPDKGAAWPAQATIAAKLRMERRTVRRALADLLERGFLRCVDAGGPRRSARYTLVPGDSPDMRGSVPGAVERRQKAPKGTRSGRRRAPSDGAAPRPEHAWSRSQHGGTMHRAAGARGVAGAPPRAGSAKAKPERKCAKGKQVERRPPPSPAPLSPPRPPPSPAPLPPRPSPPSVVATPPRPAASLPSAASTVRDEWLRVGARAFHHKFGAGTITAVEDDKVDMVFDRDGMPKRLLTRFVEAL